MDPTASGAAFDRVPVNGWLGLRLAGRAPGSAEVHLPARPELCQEAGVVHGGVLATLADTAAVYCFFPDLPAEGSMTSIEFKLNFLRAARGDGAPLVARARALRTGRRVGVATTDVTQGEATVAVGTFTYLFRDPPAGPRAAAAARRPA